MANTSNLIILIKDWEVDEDGDYSTTRKRIDRRIERSRNIIISVMCRILWRRRTMIIYLV